MKWVVAALAVTLGGCASVSELENTPETLSVISGKKPQEYAVCVQQELAETRGPLEVEKHHDGLRLVVPQKVGAGPAALVDINERGGGSSIKLYERLNNFPLRLGDVKTAATHCISG
ncbi:hypothetical protein KC131_24055 [Pseudomonas sp. JQ170]|jgi:hypothetical protein|uniref:hypothetical protein n=1 Tax=Pseudomonas TaxID=286 RepID=UPI00041657C8|nr:MULTISPECIES: hypothetical protein [Pseudomonas]MCW2271023.1 uncharacterized protein YceK [Pseudomonas sp. JUb96]MDN7143728.1 hypothetical protein [Pseudomonas sp. JQ170]PRA65790.1 hypothetical protein CQ065_10735 [Pseudomonas sp. MYb187]WRO74103.1 hypothetical protein U9R80_16375 [Pseudomonas sp. 170C]